MRKLLNLVLVVALVMAILAGCGVQNSSDTAKTSETAKATESAATTAKSGERIKIGLTMSTTANPVFITWINGMKAKCEELGYELIVTDEKSDVNKQISSIENFMAMGCKAIIINVFDQDGIKDIVKEAADKGIFVMVHDGHVDAASCLVNVDNYTYGSKIATNAAEWINKNPAFKDAEEVQVGILQFSTIPVLKERGRGITETLAKLCPKAKVVSALEANTVEAGVTAGENFLQAYPDMKVVVGVNDAGAMGAYEAFTAAQHTGDDIGLFGGDGEAYDLIAKPSIYRATVGLTIVDTAKEMISVCDKAIKGEQTPKEIFFGQFGVNVDNVSQYLKK